MDVPHPIINILTLSGLGCSFYRKSVLSSDILVGLKIFKRSSLYDEKELCCS